MAPVRSLCPYSFRASWFANYRQSHSFLILQSLVSFLALLNLAVILLVLHHGEIGASQMTFSN